MKRYEIFRALGDPARVLILQAVLKGRPNAIQIREYLAEQGFEVGQSTISNHIKILERVSLLNHQRHGITHYYFIPYPTEVKRLLITAREMIALVKENEDTDEYPSYRKPGQAKTQRKDHAKQPDLQSSR